MEFLLRTRRHPLSILSLIAAATALDGISCRELIGIDDRNVAPSRTGGIDFLGECGTCVGNACPGEAEACGADSSCKALEACFADAGGDPASRSDCAIYNRVSAGASVAGALDACIAQNCSNECTLQCGGLSYIADPDAAASCDQCIVQQGACSIAEGCATSAECQRYFHCEQACVTGDCHGACSNDNEAGAALYGGFRPLCNSPCEVGGVWGCVGNVQWPIVKGSPRSLSFRLVDFTTESTAEPIPAANVSVSMCGGDPTCASPMDTTTTDSNGNALLVDSTNADISQERGLNGFLDVNGPGVLPTTIHWGFPLSEPAGRFDDAIPVFPTTGLPFLLFEALPPGTGIVAAVALDCLGNKAGRVHIGIEANNLPVAGAHVVYANGDGLSSSTGQTDEKGLAIVLNVPADGYVDIIATPLALGSPSSRVTVYIRPNSVTEVNLSPTPNP